jgi:hypothetical protein
MTLHCEWRLDHFKFRQGRFRESRQDSGKGLAYHQFSGRLCGDPSRGPECQVGGVECLRGDLDLSSRAQAVQRPLDFWLISVVST